MQLGSLFDGIQIENERLPQDEQDERIEDYVKTVERHCTRCNDVGLPQQGIFKRHKKFKRVTFSNTWGFLDLDEEHKKILLTKISDLYIGGKRVSLFFPKDQDTFDIGVSWY